MWALIDSTLPNRTLSSMAEVLQPTSKDESLRLASIEYTGSPTMTYVQPERREVLEGAFAQRRANDDVMATLAEALESLGRYPFKACARVDPN